MTEASNTAAKALANRGLLTFATKVVTFTCCRVYDFADGSFFVLHDNGRAEANAVNF